MITGANAGIRTVQVHKKNNVAWGATVDMGSPEWQPSRIPVKTNGESLCEYTLTTGNGNETFNISCVSMGNPHTVLFTENVDSIEVNCIGSCIERHPLFPQRTNVEFVQVLSEQELRMRVWERGTGETMACGTGACAAAVIAARLGKTSRQSRVHLTGGYLDIDWREEGNVFMTGEAVTVFEGEWNENS